MFQLFRNVSKQNWNKLWKKWKYQAPFLVFRNTETMDYIGKKLKRTETWQKLTKSKCFSCFEMFRNKIETNSEKVKIPGPISGVSKHWNNGLYWGKIETGRKLTKSKRFSCFETKLKQALEKVKIPGPISGVSKHWNNGLYREKTETDWNRKKID